MRYCGSSYTRHTKECFTQSFARVCCLWRNCVPPIFPGTAWKAHWKFHIDKSYTHCSWLTLDFLSTVPTDDRLITAWTTRITWNVIFFFFQIQRKKGTPTTAHDENNPIAGYTPVCCLHSRLLVIVCLNVCSDLHVFISSPQLYHTDTRIPIFIVLYNITLTLTWKSFLIKVLNENNKAKNQLFLKLYLLFSELCFSNFV